MPNSVHFSKKIILSFAQSPTQRKISVPVYGEMHMKKYDRKMPHSHLCRTSKMVDLSKQTKMENESGIIQGMAATTRQDEFAVRTEVIATYSDLEADATWGNSAA
ncbi:hypothetical protein B0H14DRAFT_2633418 [Mycena olivaceomarginata]|nr:hypothetical protein B0H14DRAFT_2633418 [Mycena olivaceomarginata]